LPVAISSGLVEGFSQTSQAVALDGAALHGLFAAKRPRASARGSLAATVLISGWEVKIGSISVKARPSPMMPNFSGLLTTVL
jgi:hypothetical protein